MIFYYRRLHTCNHLSPDSDPEPSFFAFGLTFFTELLDFLYLFFFELCLSSALVGVELFFTDFFLESTDFFADSTDFSDEDADFPFFYFFRLLTGECGVLSFALTLAGLI